MAELPRFLQELLGSCPEAWGGVHPWLFRVARYLHRYHTPEGIQDILETRVANCGRTLEPHEIPDAINNSASCAWGMNGTLPTTTARERRAQWIAAPTASKVPSFKPELAERIAGCVPVEVTPEWLKTHSPVSVECSTQAFLQTIFREREKYLVFTDYRSQGHIYPGNRLSLERVTQINFTDGVWFLCNPVDGQKHLNPRRGKDSQRSEESITSFRHAVLESDHEPREQWRPIWLRILAGLELPILAITDSGNRSDHALVLVPASTKQEWNAYKHRVLRPLVELGADDGALSAVRLTRLPGCWRNDRRQELLYFNPTADGIPIYKQTTL
jgi:hypothetical protein